MASNASIQRLRVFGAEADPSVDAERVCLLTADLAAGSPSSSADGGAASSSALGATPPSPPAITLAWMFYQNLKHSLFGSVKAAVLLTRRRDGSLHATADAQKVAVKVTEKVRFHVLPQLRRGVPHTHTARRRLRARCCSAPLPSTRLSARLTASPPYDDALYRIN